MWVRISVMCRFLGLISEAGVGGVTSVGFARASEPRARMLHVFVTLAKMIVVRAKVVS